MYVNYRESRCSPPGLFHLIMCGRCLVDGVEIAQVWFVDTDAGLVKSYNVLGDRKPHWAGEPELDVAELIKNPDVEEVGRDGDGRERAGMLSKTHRGAIELFSAAGVRVFPE